MAGENDRLIYVNMTDQSVSVEPFPQEWKLLGGRALSARILLEQCDPACDALGPDNVLVMAPGVLSGTTAPTSGRISMGGKSPLTNGIKEANAGGNPGQDLMKLGYRAVVVKGPRTRKNAMGCASTARTSPSSKPTNTRVCGITPFAKSCSKARTRRPL